MDQRHRDVEPALHAARVAARDAVRRIGQPELGQELVRPRDELAFGMPWIRPWSIRFSRPGQVAVDARVLGDDADRPADLSRF